MLGDVGHRVRGGVAAADQQGPHGGVDEPLHAAQPRGVGDAVLQKPQGAAGPDDPAELRERPWAVGDRAQHQAQHGGVGGAVLQRQPFGPAGQDDDGHRRAPGRLGGQVPQVRLGFDGEHPGDGRWVVGEVQAVARSDLHDLAG